MLITSVPSALIKLTSWLVRPLAMSCAPQLLAVSETGSQLAVWWGLTLRRELLLSHLDPWPSNASSAVLAWHCHPGTRASWHAALHSMGGLAVSAAHQGPA